MTPAARVASAIEILDRIIAGEPGEKVLTNWARSNRYAGSGDRAAVRDHVFDALRCRRSFGHLGGSDTGRGLMIGAIRAQGEPLGAVFSGQGYGPTELTPDEIAYESDTADAAVLLDCPNWMLPFFQEGLGEKTFEVLENLKNRAPVFLRANLARTTVQDAIKSLASEGIESRVHGLSPSAVEVLSKPRKVQISNTFMDGLVEIQDAASQAVVDLLPTTGGATVLDFCAGGGGKSLALATRGNVDVTAHDALPHRMVDIPTRAERAQVAIKIAELGDLKLGGYDLVLCDVPCSGTGAWRRSPANKWVFDQQSLDELLETQQGILDQVVNFVKTDGTLAYVTCSLLAVENHRQIERFLVAHPEWTLTFSRQFTPLDGGDGFYIALLTRA